MAEVLDQQAINLAKAIRQTETGGDFNSKGASGEWGGYQFMPNTWNSLNKKYGTNYAFGSATKEQQNELAYRQIKEWKDQGLAPDKIASLWNSGSPDYQGKSGVNSKGIKYDVPKYVNSVYSAYQTIKGGREAGVDPNNPSSTAGAQMGDVPQKSLISKVGSLAKETFNVLTQSEANLGKDIGRGILGGDKFQQGLVSQYEDNSKKLAELAAKQTDPALKNKYLDMSKSMFEDGVKVGEDFKGRTWEQIAGDVAGVALDVGTTIGGLGLLKGAKALKATEAIGEGAGIASKALKGAKAGAKVGALFGGAYGGIQGLQDNKDIVGILGSGAIGALFGGATGGVLGGATGGISGIKNSVINGELAAWEKPTTVPKASYNKATEIYTNAAEKGNNISKTLLNDGVRFSDHVENGVYNTADRAEIIRKDAAKASNEMLRPSLEAANPSVERTTVKEVIDNSVKNINKNKLLTQETKDTLVNSLEKTQSSLEKKYPEGMSLTDLHDEKIVRDANARYSPIGDIATNNEAQKNKAIADASRKILESKAPKDLPLKEFNTELSKQFQSAEYLDSLHGKKSPVNLMSKIGRTTAKLAGATIGEGLGGGPVGAYGGYKMGDMVGSIVENLPNPIRQRILNNLEKTNPEVFQKMIGFLDKEASQQAERLALPEGKTIYAEGPKPKLISNEELAQLRAENNARIKQQQFNNTLALPEGKTIYAEGPKPKLISNEELAQLRAENNARIKQQQFNNTLALPEGRRVISLESPEVVKGKSNIKLPKKRK